jgi:hypothetical protein
VLINFVKVEVGCFGAAKASFKLVFKELWLLRAKRGNLLGKLVRVHASVSNIAKPPSPVGACLSRLSALPLPEQLRTRLP